MTIGRITNDLGIGKPHMEDPIDHTPAVMAWAPIGHQIWFRSTLWLCQNSYWSHGPVEIVDFPLKNAGSFRIFPSFFGTLYQRVSHGISVEICDASGWMPPTILPVSHGLGTDFAWRDHRMTGWRWCAMNSAKQRHPKGNEPGNLSGSRNSWTIINMSWTCHEHVMNISLTFH